MNTQDSCFCRVIGTIGGLEEWKQIMSVDMFGQHASTTFSTTFDKKLRLEIGRYEPGSLESRVRFLSSGLTIATLQQFGNVCWSNDALQMEAITGASTSPTLLTSQVGAGSSWHCLAGDFLNIFATSSLITGDKSMAHKQHGHQCLVPMRRQWTHECGQFLTLNDVQNH